MVQINTPPDEPEKLEDIERILPPRDRWPDQRLKREAARSFHIGVGFLIYFCAGFIVIVLGLGLGLLAEFTPIHRSKIAVELIGFVIVGLFPLQLVGFTIYAYTKLGWKRFPLTMLLIPAPVVILVVLELVF